MSQTGHAPEIDFKKIVQGVPIGICVLDHGLRYLFCNDALAWINGVAAANHLGRSIHEVLPDLAPELERHFREALSAPQSTMVRKTKGFTPKAPAVERIWLERVRSIVDESGNATSLIVTVQEITDAERAEEQVRLVSREFRHRLHNLFAVIGALVMNDAQSSSDVDEFATRLLRRLASLADAQKLLSRDESAVGLDEIASAALKPFDLVNLHLVKGPDVLLRSEAAVSLALALNELATNALKYGGLRNSLGAASLTWTKVDERVTLHWDEQNVAALRGDQPEGFGTKLLRRAARGLPKSDLRFKRNLCGLHVELSFAEPVGKGLPTEGCGTRQPAASQSIGDTSAST